MQVLVLKKAPSRLRALVASRSIEVSRDVFVMNLDKSALDALCAEVGATKGDGYGALLVKPARTLQGFTAFSVGSLAESLIEVDGLLLHRK